MDRISRIKPGSRRGVLAVAAVLLVVVVLLSAGIVAGAAMTGALQPPTVERIDNRWGPIGEERAEIETAVVVDNPNPVAVPDVATVRYSVRLNDVVVANGSKDGVGMPPGESTIALTSEMEHRAIARWWPTHINNGERTVLSVDSEVSAFGLSQSLPPHRTRITTDLLGAIQSDRPKPVTYRGEDFLVVRDQRASWGHATRERTPLSLAVVVENAHDHPVDFDRVGYTIRMNDVVVGNGTSPSGFNVETGETGTLAVNATLDTPKMATWWETHLRRGERSVVSVELYGIASNDENDTARVELLNRTLRFETDFLGDGSASVTTLPTEGPDQAYRPVSTRVTGSSWESVTRGTTTISTEFVVENPNGDPELNDLLRLDVTSKTVINGVPVANDTTTASDIRQGENVVRVTNTLDNQRVPRWWARHINNGERSTISTVSGGQLDVGFTRFDLRLPDERRVFTTDLLEGMTSERERSVTHRGMKVLTVEETRARWGTATEETVPLRLSATARNPRESPVVIRSINYTVRINDVVLADANRSKRLTIPPGEARTIDLPMALDNSKMDRWWVSHLRNEEMSRFSITAYATVEMNGRTRRIPLSFFDQERVIETDILNGTG